VADAEAENVEGIVAELVEGRIGEAVDDGQRRRGDIAKNEGPEGRNRPVLALADDEVEIATKLVALK
jgi:hypothetical protein